MPMPHVLSAIFLIVICLVIGQGALQPDMLMSLSGLSPDQGVKSGPKHAWPFSPSWLYLLLPLIMSTMYIRMKWDLYRYGAQKVAPNPDLQLQLSLPAAAQSDPELAAIAHLLGRELSLEEWGTVRLTNMTDRQLQALGFLPGCPFMNAPQYRGKSVQEVAALLGYSHTMIANHASKHGRGRLANHQPWSDPGRCEEVFESANT